jgi:hypothetical protein
LVSSDAGSCLVAGDAFAVRVIDCGSHRCRPVPTNRRVEHGRARARELRKQACPRPEPRCQRPSCGFTCRRHGVPIGGSHWPGARRGS